MQGMGSSARLSALTGLAFDWWWELDRDLRLASLSESFAERFGLQPSAFIGHPIVGSATARVDWRGPYADLQARRPFRDIETTISDSQGRARAITISGAPEFDSSGTFLGYVGIGRELKGASDATCATASSPAVLDSVLDNIDQGFVVIDADLKICTINRRGHELLGLAPDEGRPGTGYEEMLWLLAGRDEFAGEDAASAVAARMARAQAPKRDRRERSRPDGSIVDVRTFPIPGGGFVLVYTDMTDLRQREAQLRQSQKMEAIGQLTGGVAHDFNNALMVIMANIEVLLEDATEERTKRRLDRMHGAAQRAAELVQQLLAMARKQKLKPQLTDLNELVTGTTKLLQRTLGEHIEIRTILAKGAWRANVDRAQLESALDNLCVNARDAMRGGGRLLIETRNTSFDDDYVAQNPDAVVGEYVLLAVTDTGTGMTPDILERAFEPFFTTKDIGAGTGLGLSMVYGFIKQSNGHIKIYSEPGHGTTIRMYLPRGETGGTGERAAAVSAMPRGDERILLVEDDEQVRVAVLDQLQSLGYQVTQAANGPEGLEVLRQDAEFDLLLTDVVMPWPLTGKQLADEVSKRWPHMRILFMSGYTENAMLNHGHLAPGARLLGKPFRKIDLARAVRRTLDDEEDED